MKFRKKPVVIEAVLYEGGNDRDGYRFAEMQPDWLSSAFRKEPAEVGSIRRGIDGSLYINTLEGTHRAHQGDWIIQGVQGELYPCKPDIFAETYEPA